ncbi:hypothetical protein [Nostoc sp. ChiSLP03a]|uniref:hypothetical protein n=1 Tax=Nostoc sp. ChiSLP03a TaxID=3075380 RepID=UPI002AD43B12|nr:hypothetical protein [Nostoc sp. ChiSLP03a]MDZ8216011.1 hypothetical protein [Nostoc sp. ChiSLP03a]
MARFTKSDRAFIAVPSPQSPVPSPQSSVPSPQSPAITMNLLPHFWRSLYTAVLAVSTTEKYWVQIYTFEFLIVSTTA